MPHIVFFLLRVEVGYAQFVPLWVLSHYLQLLRSLTDDHSDTIGSIGMGKLFTRTVRALFLTHHTALRCLYIKPHGNAFRSGHQHVQIA